MLPGQGGGDGAPAIRGAEADVGGHGGQQHAPPAGLLRAVIALLAPESLVSHTQVIPVDRHPGQQGAGGPGHGVREGDAAGAQAQHASSETMSQV